MQVERMDGCLLKGKPFVCREWAFSKLLHCVETRPQAKTCGTLILGGPGSGKTALCCELRWPTGNPSRPASQNTVHTSRHELRKQELHSRLLAAHFCEAHNIDSLAVFTFVCNVREQILQDAHVRTELVRIASYAQKCARLFEEAVQRADVDDAFVHGVAALLAHVAPPERHRFLLIDSLDESFLCDDTLANVSQSAVRESEDTRLTKMDVDSGGQSACKPNRSRTIAELLSRHHSTMPCWLSLVCTVRKQSRSVTRLFTGFRTITLDDTKKTHVVRDVQQYILHRVEADDSLRALLNNRDSVEMLNALHIKSNACFLYLETVLNGIQDNFVALREVKDIPGTLNGLYLWLCQRLFSKRSLFQQVQPILNAIVASRAPLSESHLFVALWSRDHKLDYANFSSRLDLLGRLLVYGPAVCPSAPSTPGRVKGVVKFDAVPTDNTLLLFHHSFAEWLLDVKLCTRKYLCNVQDGHAMLAMARTLHCSLPDELHSSRANAAHRVAEYVLHVCKCVLDPSYQRPGSLSAASSSVLLQHAGLNLTQLALSSSRKQNANNALLNDSATETSNSMSASLVGTPASDSAHSGNQLSRAHIALWFLFSGVDLSALKHLQLSDVELSSQRSPKRLLDSLLERFSNSLSSVADRHACTADSDEPRLAETSQDINAIASQIQAMTASVNRSFASSAEKTSAENCPTLSDEPQAPLVARLDSQTLPVTVSRRSSTHGRNKPCGSSSNVNVTPTPSAETQSAASKLLLCAAAAQGNLHIVRAVLDAADADANVDLLVNVRDRNGATPLSLAARHGHAEVLELLVANRADLDVFDNDGWSALRAAAWAGNTAIVDVLLRAGAKPNATGIDRRTAIRAAAWNGHEDVVKLLLNAGADVNLPDIEGRTPLIAAAYMGHVDIIELLIDANADINHSDNDGRSALSIACMCVSSTSYHPQIISILLEHGAEANRYDRDGMTPLLIAVYEGNRDVCEILLEWDVDIECVDRQGRTPLLAAVVMGHASIVNTLLFWGAQVDTIDAEGRSILSIAAAYGVPDVLGELLARGLDEQHRDNAGLTPLHLAAFEGHADACRLLLENGAHVNQLDNDGRTALLLATQESQLDCIRTLVDFGASVDLPAHDGRSPLRCVALENNYQLVESLVREFGADLDARDADGRTCLYVLVLESRLEMVRLLLELRADPALPDADGRTCLHVAAWQGALEILDALLAFGAPPDAVDAEGRTPLQIAAWQGHERLIGSLVRAGANVDHACAQGATALSVAAQEGHLLCVRVLLDAGANTQHQDQFGRTPLRVALKNQHLEIVQLLERASGAPANSATTHANAQAIAPPAPPTRSHLRASPLPKSIAQSQLTLFRDADEPECEPTRHSGADFKQLALNSAVQNQLQNALRSSSNSSNSNCNTARVSKSQQPPSVTSSSNSLQQVAASLGNARLSAVINSNNSAAAPSTSNGQLANAISTPTGTSSQSSDPQALKRPRKRHSNRSNRITKAPDNPIGNDADAYFERGGFNEELDYGAALIMDGLAQFSALSDPRPPVTTTIAEEQPNDAELSDESDDNADVTATDSNFLWNGDPAKLNKSPRGKQQHVVDSTSWQRGHRRDADGVHKTAKDSGQAAQQKRSGGLFGFFRRKDKKRDESLNSVDKPSPLAASKNPAVRKQRSNDIAEQTQREQLITQELIQQQRHAILQQQANMHAAPSAMHVSRSMPGNGNGNGPSASPAAPLSQLAVPQPLGAPNSVVLRHSNRVSASSGSQQGNTPNSSRPNSMVIHQPAANDLFALAVTHNNNNNVSNSLSSVQTGAMINAANVASAKRETHL